LQRSANKLLGSDEVTFSVIHLLQALTDVIFAYSCAAFDESSTDWRSAHITRSLCDSWASCSLHCTF